MWDAFAKLSDAEVLRLWADVSGACVEVQSMSTEERHRIRGKGKVSADEAVKLSGMIGFALSKELEKRGL